MFSQEQQNYRTVREACCGGGGSGNNGDGGNDGGSSNGAGAGGSGSMAKVPGKYRICISHGFQGDASAGRSPEDTLGPFPGESFLGVIHSIV